MRQRGAAAKTYGVVVLLLLGRAALWRALGGWRWRRYAVGIVVVVVARPDGGRSGDDGLLAVATARRS